MFMVPLSFPPSLPHCGFFLPSFFSGFISWSDAFYLSDFHQEGLIGALVPRFFENMFENTCIFPLICSHLRGGKLLLGCTHSLPLYSVQGSAFLSSGSAVFCPCPGGPFHLLCLLAALRGQVVLSNGCSEAWGCRGQRRSGSWARVWSLGSMSWPQSRPFLPRALPARAGSAPFLPELGSTFSL